MDQKAPDEYKCAITLEIMHDPVICSDGHTYERQAIERWFAQGKHTSPKTGARLQNQEMHPNHALRNAIERWRETFFREIKPSQVVVKWSSQIGRGSFGRIFAGELNQRQIAVKAMSPGQCEEEAAKLIKMGRHPGLLRYLGICNLEQHVTLADGYVVGQLLITELAPFGSLDNLLEVHSVSMAHKLSIIRQIASAMESLTMSDIVHCDLAIRNVLVFAFDESKPADVQVKIGDFGLSISRYYQTHAYRQGDIVPMRWMAPETIKKRKWSEKSDVWAFGVTVWELLTDGEIPYCFIGSNEEVGKRVCDGSVRLEMPGACPVELWTIVVKCWAARPEDRPTFRALVAALEGLWHAQLAIDKTLKFDGEEDGASFDQEATKRIASADRALEARKEAEAAERVAAAERAMAARVKDHSATSQRQREEERRREEKAMAEERRRQEEELWRVEEERRRKEAQRRADWQADSYRRDYRRDQYNWREDNHQPQLHIPGGFARGDTVASREGYIGNVLRACTVDHRRVSVDFGNYGIQDMLVSQINKVKSATRAAAEELKKQPAPKGAMETFQGAVGGAAAAATTTAISFGGAMIAVVGATFGAAIGGSGLLSADDMSAVPTVPSEALNPEEAEVGKPSVKEIEKKKAEKDVQPSPAQPKTQQAFGRQTNVNKAPSLSNSPTEEATENVAAASLPFLGGFAKGDAVLSRITRLLQNGAIIMKGDPGTVLGACTVDHRRVSVDFGRYGIWNMLVSPDSEAQICKVPSTVGVHPHKPIAADRVEGIQEKDEIQALDERGAAEDAALAKEIEKKKAEKDVQPSPAQPKTQQAEAFGSAAAIEELRLEGNGSGILVEAQKFDKDSRVRVNKSGEKTSLGYVKEYDEKKQVYTGDEEDWILVQKHGLDPRKPPRNRPPPDASAAAGAGTAAARLPKRPPGAAAAAPQHAGAAQTPPKPLAAGRAGTGTAPKLELPPPAGAGVAVLATTNAAATPKAGAAGDEVTLSHDGAAATRARCHPLDRQTNVNKAPSLSNSPTEEATENVAAASLPHTARTDSSADFLDDLKEAEAKDEAKAQMKAEKVATSATKKAGKEATAAKKKTSVSPVTACSKQSSAAP